MGKDGGFYVAGSLVTFIDSWTLNLSRGLEEVGAYGDDWDKVAPTVKSWNASFSGTLDRSDTQQAALLDQLEDAEDAAQVVRLATERGSDYWEGSSYIESMSINSTHKGKVAISGNLRGHGEITYTGS
jgi:hypothetical protein